MSVDAVAVSPDEVTALSHASATFTVGKKTRFGTATR